MTSLRDLLGKLLENVVLALMAGLALLVVVAVVFRKAGAPLVWYDEMAPILLAWLTYYGAALAALKHAHIGFPKLVASAPRKWRLGLIAVRETFVVGFFALAAWAGWRVMLVLDDTYLVSLPWMPARVTQSVIPIGAVVFIIAELLAVVERLEREREAAPR